MAEIKHGTVYGYGGRKCRCDDCTQAYSAYCAEQQKKRVERGLPEGDSRHGTKNGYINYGCRCGSCRVARAGGRFAVREVGFGHEVYIRELGGWYVVGEKVD